MHKASLPRHLWVNNCVARRLRNGMVYVQVFMHTALRLDKRLYLRYMKTVYEYAVYVVVDKHALNHSYYITCHLIVCTVGVICIIFEFTNKTFLYHHYHTYVGPRWTCCKCQGSGPSPEQKIDFEQRKVSLRSCYLNKRPVLYNQLSTPTKTLLD